MANATHSTWLIFYFHFSNTSRINFDFSIWLKHFLEGNRRQQHQILIWLQKYSLSIKYF